jgi:predicted neuraminidase
MFKEQLPVVTAMAHAATIVETPGNNLLAAWFGGTYEGHPDTSIWMVRQEHGRWGDAYQIADVPGVAMFNPVLFRDRQDTLWLFYKVGPSVPTWSGFYMTSRDDGRSWSEPAMLPAGLIGPAKNKPITLSNGDIICGSSRETWQNWSCWVEASSDGGVTWALRGPLAIANARLSTDTAISATWDVKRGALVLPESFEGVIQPTIWEYAPGQLKMLMRSTRAVGVLCTSTSTNFGRTWSAVTRTTVPNPNSSVDAIRVGGRVIIACNPTREGRSPLSLLMSDDNGVSWPYRCDLETEPGEYSYPALIQTNDGLLHIVYTYRRICIRHVTISVAELAATLS